MWRHRQQRRLGINVGKWSKDCGIPVSILAAERRRRHFFGGKRRWRSTGGSLGAGTAYNLLGWLLNVRACITSESCGCRSAAVTSLATLTLTKVETATSVTKCRPRMVFTKLMAWRWSRGNRKMIQSKPYLIPGLRTPFESLWIPANLTSPNK